MVAEILIIFAFRGEEFTQIKEIGFFCRLQFETSNKQ